MHLAEVGAQTGPAGGSTGIYAFGSAEGYLRVVRARVYKR